MSHLHLQPVSFPEAAEFIRLHHRHHLPMQGWKFGIAVNDEEKIVGVIAVGRPVARFLDNGLTLEITRLCTDGTSNACSILYAAAWRAAKALGYKRLITYTLKEEINSSLLASNYKIVYETKGGSWNRESRKRIDKHPVGEKILWEVI